MWHFSLLNPQPWRTELGTLNCSTAVSWTNEPIVYTLGATSSINCRQVKEHNLPRERQSQNSGPGRTAAEHWPFANPILIPPHLPIYRKFSFNHVLGAWKPFPNSQPQQLRAHFHKQKSQCLQGKAGLHPITNVFKCFLKPPPAAWVCYSGFKWSRSHLGTWMSVQQILLRQIWGQAWGRPTITSYSEGAWAIREGPVSPQVES